MELLMELDKMSVLASLEEMPSQIEKATIRALNKSADYARTRAAERVREQVNFPAAYLGPSGGRLTVSKRAAPGSMEAITSGRDRATSLQRFAVRGTPKPGQLTPTGQKRTTRDGSVTVEVKPGVRRKIARAFIVSLRNGNLGLAVRTNGPKPPGAYKPKPFGKNAWLLYGPSVDQVLSAATTSNGVFEEIEPDVLNTFEGELLRQIKLNGVTK